MENTLRAFVMLPLVLGLAAAIPAQSSTVVDYPDSAIEAPTLAFPFYTVGSGGTVRYQTLCPAGFAGLPATPMVATRVGFQLAGQAHYQRFEVRIGRSPVATLANDWLSNLPDQRLQVDLGGTTVVGGSAGGQPANAWVEHELALPFVWTPGDGIALDIIASATTPGAWCETAVVAGNPRVFAAPYQDGMTSGALSGTNGIKFRVVFEPLGAVPYGASCAGAGGFAPTITANGIAALGGNLTISLDDAPGAAVAFLALGFSRSDMFGATLPIALGGGCELLTSVNASLLTVASGSLGAPAVGRASETISVPQDVSLRELVLFAQWLCIDPLSPSALGLTSSGGIAIPVF